MMENTVISREKGRKGIERGRRKNSGQKKGWGGLIFIGKVMSPYRGGQQD